MVVLLLESHAEKKAKLDENPILELKPLADKYFYTCQRKKRKQESSSSSSASSGVFNTVQAKLQVQNWLKSVRQVMPRCYHVDKKGSHGDLNCSCLANVDIELASDFVVKYCLATCHARDMMVRNILYHAEEQQQEQEQVENAAAAVGAVVGLPYQIYLGQGKSIQLCLDSFLNLLHIGEFKYDSMKKANEDGVIGRRKDVASWNINRNSSRKKAQPCVIQFLLHFAQQQQQQMPQQQQEEQQPIQQQQQENDQSDNNNNQHESIQENQDNTDLTSTTTTTTPIFLAESWTKKAIYEEFIFHQGYQRPRWDGHSTHHRIKDFVPRSDEEWLGKEPLPICSLASFSLIWQNHVSHLRLTPRRKGDEQPEPKSTPQEDNHNNNHHNNDSENPWRRKRRLLLSDVSGHPYAALREAHETLLEENQSLREHCKDLRESHQEEILAYQEQIQQLQDKVACMELQFHMVFSARNNHHHNNTTEEDTTTTTTTF